MNVFLDMKAEFAAVLNLPLQFNAFDLQPLVQTVLMVTLNALESSESKLIDKPRVGWDKG